MALQSMHHANSSGITLTGVHRAFGFLTFVCRQLKTLHLNLSDKAMPYILQQLSDAGTAGIQKIELFWPPHVFDQASCPPFYGPYNLPATIRRLALQSRMPFSIFAVLSPDTLSRLTHMVIQGGKALPVPAAGRILRDLDSLQSACFEARGNDSVCACGATEEWHRGQGGLSRKPMRRVQFLSVTF